MTAGATIAARVAAGLARVGTRAGADAVLTCTIKRPASGGGEPQTPWDAEDTTAGDPTYYEVTAMQDMEQVRDAAGTLIGQTHRVLTISATGAVPQKSDLIAVGVAEADVDADTVFEEIADIAPLAPGGVALLYEVRLAD